MMIAHAKSPSPFLDDIGNSAHRLGAACDHDIGISQNDFLISQNNRLQPRTARLVHRVCRHFLRNAGSVADLPRGIRTITGASRMTNHYLVDGGALDTGAGERPFNRYDSKINCA